MSKICQTCGKKFEMCESWYDWTYKYCSYECWVSSTTYIAVARILTDILGRMNAKDRKAIRAIYENAMEEMEDILERGFGWGI